MISQNKMRISFVCETYGQLIIRRFEIEFSTVAWHARDIDELCYELVVRRHVSALLWDELKLWKKSCELR